MGIALSPSMVLKLTIAVPMALLDAGPLIAVPMVLSMGWMESSLTICTVTDTITDLVNADIAQGYIPAPYHCHDIHCNWTVCIMYFTFSESK